MKYKISINKPCQENWNAMSPTQQGAFCAICKKDVVDFTNLPVSQFKHHIKKGTCGRLTASQLAAEYDFGTSTRFSRVAAAVSMTALLAGAATTQVQIGTPLTEQFDYNTDKENILKQGKNSALNDTIRITGKVVDASDEGIFNAIVTLENTSLYATTDFDGNYLLKIPSTSNLKSAKIHISSIGFERATISLSELWMYNEINLNKTTLHVMLMGEVVIQRRTFFGRLLNVFRKKENRY